MALHSRKIFDYESWPKKSESETDRAASPPPPPLPPKHSFPASLVISLGIAGVALLFLSYIALRSYASRRRSSLPPPPQFASYGSTEDFADGLRGPAVDHPVWYIRTVGLPQSTVDSIQQFSYKKGEGSIGADGCAVCLSEFDDGDSLRLLPKCSHAFHVACIDTWLGSHTNCPLCRAPVLTAADGSRSGPVESSSSFILNDRGSGEEIEIGGEGSGGISDGGGISNRTMIGREMEPMRRSVSLDYSSAVNGVGAKKDFWRVRSISLSGPSMAV